MNHEKTNLRLRERRKFRVRKRLHGTSEKPRLSVFRSHQHVYAQLIDDDAGRTLAAASTQDGAIRGEVSYGGNKAAAQIVGRALAERAIAAGVKKVCFDRGPFKYHGRVQALAEGAREGGLEF